MNMLFRSHSPLAAHSAHRVDASLQGSTTPPAPLRSDEEVAASFVEEAGRVSSSRRKSFSSRETSVATTGDGDGREGDAAKKHTAPRKSMAPQTLAAAPPRELPLALGEVVGRIMQSSVLRTLRIRLAIIAKRRDAAGQASRMAAQQGS